MNLFKSTLRGATIVAFLISSFVTSFVFADGTRQVSPTNSANGASLLSAPDISAGPFRGAADNKRLRFTILNNATENLYFGFQPRTYDNNATTLKNNAYYRIFNAAGTQVAGPTLIPVAAGPGFISTYAQAFAGPNIGGATPAGYNPFLFNPTTNGDFYIELYSSNDGGATADATVSGRVTFPFFDLTVSTTANVQSIGRLWSKEWSFVTTHLTSGNFEQSLSSSFTGKFIAYTPDAFKLQINYQPGFRPLAYRVSMNYEGIGNTGVYENDRKSINSTTGSPTIANGYKVFLTDPDDAAFPDGIIGNAAVTSNIFGCNGNYYIPYWKDQPGDISLLIDLNGVAGYQTGTSDILLQEFGQPAGNNVFMWNGLDGLGTPVPANFTALVTAVLFQGRTNLPMYDAELNTGGLSVTGIYPATGNRRLYWDDSSITPFGTCSTQEENETTGGLNQGGLYLGVFGPTHAWDGSNPNLTVPAASGTQGSSTLGALCDDYGNNRTINTWFYATDIVSNTLTLSLPFCDNDNDGVSDNIDLDDDNDGIYDAVEYASLPDPWADADSDGIPNFLDPSAAGFVDVDHDGVDDRYDLDLDGKINQFDLDTDNDGIADNIEAQSTMGYIAPTGTINAQGVYPSYFSLGGLTPVNTDGTDTPDYKDLNSDNQGGNDTAEAGITLSGTDADGDGLDNATDATPTTGYADVNGIYDNTQFNNFPDADADAQTGGNVDWRDATFDDHDNDGVADAIDLDDDNDGILDTEECNIACSDQFSNGNFETPVLSAITQGDQSLTNGWQTTATDGLIEFWPVPNPFGVPAASGNQFAELNATQVSTLYQTFCLNGSAGTVNWSIRHRGRQGVDVANVKMGASLGTATVIQVMSDGNTAWGTYSGTYTIPAGQSTLVIAFESVSAAGGNQSVGNFIDDVQITITQGCADFDLDGVQNSYDLDSDNDGIFDVIEAGGVDSDNNGTANDNDNNVNNTASNGIPTSAGAGTTPLDFGSNGTPNFLNLDSDGDGCFDVTEALFIDQNNNGILGNNPTVVNANGVVTGTTVVNGYTGTTPDVTSAGTPGVITVQPIASTSIPTGASGSISVTATGSGLVYQWQVSTNGGTTWTNISNGGTSPVFSGATTASLGLSNVPNTSNGHQFRVLITSSNYKCTNLTSTVSTLSVSPSADVTIVKTASTLTPTVGGTVQFFLTVSNASGGSTATGVSVSDVIPAGYTISGTPTASPAIGTVNVAGQTITWNGSSLNSGTNAVLTINCNVTATNAYANTATVTSSVPDPNSANNTSTVTPTPISQADVSITKTASTMTPTVGGTVTFTITASNAGLNTATGVSVADIIPAGYSISGTPTASPAIGTISVVGQNITWNGFSLNNGSSAALTVVCNVLAAGPYGNTATITSAIADPNSGNNSATVTPVPSNSADVSITKSASSMTPAVGGTVTFTITASNAGLSTATGVSVSDLVPAGYTISGTPTASPAIGTVSVVGQNITWNGFSLNSGSNATLTVICNVLATGPYGNTATITSSVSDPNPGDNSATVTPVPTPSANLSITKTASSLTPTVGNTVTFTLTAANAGLSTATGVSVTDLIPSGYTISGTPTASPAIGTVSVVGQNVTWNGFSLNSGANAALTVVCNVLPTGTYANTASITSAVADPTPGNNTSTVTPVPTSIADLVITKTVSNTTPNVGSNVTFTITVTNNGPSPATNVLVRDTLRSGYTYVSSTAPAGMTYNTSGGSIWQFTPASALTLASGASAVFTITATVKPSGVYANCANVSSTVSDPSLANNRACAATVTPVPQTDLNITKTISNATPTVGSNVTFTLTANNAGPSNATGVTMTDVLPSGYTFVNTIPAGVGSYNAGTNTYTWAIGTLNSGPTTSSVQIVATVNPTGSYTNCVSVSGNQVDPTPANNTACVTPIPVAQANLSIVKTASPSAANVGGTVSFGITVSNSGPSTATGVVVNDTLPTGFIYSSSVPAGVYDPITHVWTIGTLTSGSSTNLLINATVGPNGMEADYINKATVSSPTADPISTNNIDTAKVTVTQVANLAVSKTYSPANPTVGTQVVFTVTATNLGLSNATGVTVADPIPTGYTLDSVVTSAGTYAAGVWTINNLSATAGLNSQTMLVYAHVLATGNKTNTATISGTEPDPLPGNNTVSVTPGIANSAPIANGDVVAVPLTEDGANGTVAILPNDTDADGNPSAPTNGAGQFVVDMNPTTPAIDLSFSDATGTWTYNPTTGVVTFDPETNYNGTATIPYQLCDAQGACDTALITFTVSPVNDAPSQGNETMTVAEDAPSTLSPVLTTNNVDPDGTPVTITSAGPSSEGVVVTINPGGTISYTPPAGFNGTDTIIYTVCDNGIPLPASCVTDTLIITVSSVNDAPIANGDVVAAPLTEDGANGTVAILPNDTDADGNPTAPTNGAGQFVVDMNPTTPAVDLSFSDATGTWTYNPTTGVVTFDPETNYNGTATIAYQLCDAQGACDSALITFTVSPVNDAPSQGNETMTVAEDAPSTLSPVLTTNNVDPDGTPVTITSAGPSSEGVVVTINPGGTISYTPPAGFNGTDTIIYTVCDNGIPLPASCVTDTLIITVTSVNDAPIANGDVVIAPLTEDGANGTVAILPNDTDVDGNPTAPTNGAGQFVVDMNPTTPAVDLTFTDATGTWTYNPTTGVVTFDPETNYNGTATIPYQLCDAFGACDTALITFTVSPVNDAPSQGNETMTVAEDAPSTLSPVLTTNNVDPDGTPVTITSAGPSSEGVVVTINPGGTISYTPPAGFNGTDTIIYTVCDNGIPLPASCVTDTLIITVTSVNDAPIANGDVVIAPLTEDGANGTVAILPNDTDVDGNPTAPTNGAGQFVVDMNPTTPAVDLSFSDATGTYTYNPTTGVVTFDPETNYNGTATIAYQLCDAQGACDTALITFTVSPVNDAPSQGNETMTVAEDAPSTLSPVLTTNNVDPDGTPVTITSAGPSSEGVVVTINPGGTISYTPPTNFNGTDTVVYTVCDSGTPLPAICVTDTLIITVTSVNDAPIANGDEVIAPLTEDGANGTVAILPNDTDVDGNPTAPTNGAGQFVVDMNPTTPAVDLTFTDATGTWTYNPTTGVVTFDPETNYNGTATIPYQLCDPQGACDTALITFTVSPVNDAPIAINDTTSTDEDVLVVFNITNNDIDVDGNLSPSTVVLDTVGNTFGTWTVDLVGNVTYTPAPNFNGTASVNYTVLDSTGAISNVATYFVIVNPINDTPVVDNDYLYTSINVTGSGDVISTGDTDVEGPLTANPILVLNPSHGTLTVLPNGNYTYVPTTGYVGNDTAVVSICDNGFPIPIICVNDTIFIVVIPTTPPIANPDFATTNEDSPGVVFNISNNDTDLETSVVPASVDLSPAPGIQHDITNTFGTWTVNNSGTMTFVPLANFCGTATLNYWINDTDGATSTSPGLITVTVNCVNDAPITTDVVLSTPINTTIGVNVSAGTSDIENNPLTYTYGSPSVAGTIVNSTSGPGNFDVTPLTGFTGIITIPYTVCDASPYNVNVLCDNGVVTIVVVDTTAANNAPIANNDLVTTPKDSSVTVNPLGNDTDVNGDPLAVTILTLPTVPGATVGPVGPLGQITYNPAPGFTGKDSVLYQVCDNGIPQLCDVAYVVFYVSPGFDTPNTATVATNDFATIGEGETSTVTVVLNDTDPNGNEITLSPVVGFGTCKRNSNSKSSNG